MSVFNNILKALNTFYEDSNTTRPIFLPSPLQTLLLLNMGYLPSLHSILAVTIGIWLVLDGSEKSNKQTNKQKTQESHSTLKTNKNLC